MGRLRGDTVQLCARWDWLGSARLKRSDRTVRSAGLVRAEGSPSSSEKLQFIFPVGSKLVSKG